MSTSTENGKNLWRETIESTRNIFISNIRHFHVISIFFILPIIFTLIVYPYFHLSIFHPDYDFTGFAQDNISHYENILPGDLFSMLLFLCAVAIIVCSVVQALCSRSINLVSSIKSIRNFIILFLFFLIFSQIISIPISLLFGNQFQFPQLSVSIFETVVFIVYALFLCLFFIFAVATTTYSSVEVFYGRPVDLFSSIKSIRNSFFPLLSTFIVSNIIYVSIALVFALIFVFSVKILQSLRLIELKYDSDYLFLLVIFGLIVLVPVLIWLQVNWSLAYVITVVEFKSGYETLRRSAEMVKGNRSIALRILLYYGFVIVSMVIGAAVFLYLVDAGKGEEWRSLRVILQTVLASVLGYVLMNQYLVANMVLYMYCKGLNDEKSPSENAAGDGEYVSLPFEEEEEKNQATV